MITNVALNLKLQKILSPRPTIYRALIAASSCDTSFLKTPTGNIIAVIVQLIPMITVVGAYEAYHSRDKLDILISIVYRCIEIQTKVILIACDHKLDAVATVAHDVVAIINGINGDLKKKDPECIFIFALVKLLLRNFDENLQNKDFVCNNTGDHFDFLYIFSENFVDSSSWRSWFSRMAPLGFNLQTAMNKLTYTTAYVTQIGYDISLYAYTWSDAAIYWASQV